MPWSVGSGCPAQLSPVLLLNTQEGWDSPSCHPSLGPSVGTSQESCRPQGHAPHWCRMSLGHRGRALFGKWPWSRCFCNKNHWVGSEKSLSFAGMNIAWQISPQTQPCLGDFRSYAPPGGSQQVEPPQGRCMGTAPRTHPECVDGVCHLVH